jgi:hypothetical protein
MNVTIKATGSILAALVLFGCAATSQNSNPKSATAAAKDSNCLTQTGSKIASSKPNCMAFGRSYSGEDIERTGSTSAGTALAIIDPSITVHR